MNTTFERTNATDEWYTPRSLIDALGTFDLDPCAAPDPSLHFAAVNYVKADDGLLQEWEGRVFLNPPYSHPLIDEFCRKMVAHGNGILLAFNRLDNRLFQDCVLPSASAMLIIRGRIHFSGARQGAGCGSILFSFGDDCAGLLRNCNIPGFFIQLKQPQQQHQ